MFKYLGVLLGQTSSYKMSILNKVAQSKRVIEQLNPVLWSRQIKQKDTIPGYIGKHCVSW